MSEKRRVQRTRVLKRAQVILDDGSSLSDCTVRNLTNVGACVHLSCPSNIPDSFDLSFDFGHSSRRCRVIWRAESTLGILFG